MAFSRTATKADNAYLKTRGDNMKKWWRRSVNFISLAPRIGWFFRKTM
jgi:hypothetical protein